MHILQIRDDFLFPSITDMGYLWWSISFDRHGYSEQGTFFANFRHCTSLNIPDSYMYHYTGHHNIYRYQTFTDRYEYQTYIYIEQFTHATTTYTISIYTQVLHYCNSVFCFLNTHDTLTLLSNAGIPTTVAAAEELKRLAASIAGRRCGLLKKLQIYKSSLIT